MIAGMQTHTDLIGFSEIIGQEKAKEMLKRTVRQQKMAHAFLFRGPFGVGKKTVAHSFAAYINCQTPQNEEPCGSCPSCVKFRSGNHPDFMRIEPEGTAIKISQVRELKKTLAFPPFEARFRTVLLTEMHTMRREAANSLLKTLEEPPEGTVLILTGDEASDILPTIISRCQVIPFFALPYAEVAQRLATEAEVEADDAATLAAVAEGSLGRAKMLAKKDLLSLRREVIEALMDHEPHTAPAIQAVYELAEQTTKLKEDLPELLELLKTWFHDLVLYLNGAGTKIINHDLIPTLQAATNRWNLQQLAEKIELIGTAQKQLNRNCNRSHVCEVLLFALL